MAVAKEITRDVNSVTGTGQIMTRREAIEKIFRFVGGLVLADTLLRTSTSCGKNSSEAAKAADRASLISEDIEITGLPVMSMKDRDIYIEMQLKFKAESEYAEAQILAIKIGSVITQLTTQSIQLDNATPVSITAKIPTDPTMTSDPSEKVELPVEVTLLPEGEGPMIAKNVTGTLILSESDVMALQKHYWEFLKTR